MEKAVVFVHPWMWADDMFAQVREAGRKIFTIVTPMDTTRIKLDWLGDNSDHVFTATSSNADDDIEAILAQLTELNWQAVAVINGIDSALVYADRLQQVLLGYDLDISSSEIRLNKSAVNTALHRHGVRSIPTREVSKGDDIDLAITACTSFGFPLIAKPSEDTAGMAGFEVLESPEQLSVYLTATLGSRNKYFSDRFVDKVVVQPYISPEVFREFTIDCFSFEGAHVCVGISENRRDEHGVTQAFVSMDLCSKPELAALVDYVVECLTALGVKHGFTHNEVFWGTGGELYLVESNNRHAGQPVTELYNESYGPRSMESLWCNGQPTVDRVRARTQFCASVFLYNTSTDQPTGLNLDGLSCDSRITVFRAKDKPKLPLDFYANYDRMNQLGAAVFLAAPDQGVLEQNLHELRDREQKGTLFLA